MEVIQDELQKNGIRIDMTLLNIHVNRILGMYKAIYDEATSRLKADQLVDVFHENCFHTVARVMAYLTLIRCMNLPKEEDVRKLVRVVVPSLKKHYKSGWNNEFKESTNCTRDFYTYALFQYRVYTHGHYIIDGKFKKQFIITMEVIQDELQKNGVNVDIETLTEHIEYILNNYKDSYTHAVDRLTREELLLDVFHEMDVNSLGRAMAYLTLVYRVSHMMEEDTVRQAVHLAAPVIRNTGRVEGSFIRELCAWGRSLALNLWDLL